MTFFLLLWKALCNWGLAAWSWFTRGGWKLTAIAMTAIVAILFVRHARHVRAERDAAEAALVVAKADNALLKRARIADDTALATRDGRRSKIATKEAHDIERTKAALQAHRDWADQPVPADVLDSLL